VTDVHHEPHESHPGVPAPGAAGHDEPGPPQTDDIVIDAALRDLAAVPEEDLDGQLAAGEHVQRTLQSRLADLGG
jgi:hypothetical protein